MAWFALSFFHCRRQPWLPGADARIIVGVSTMNVAFLPVYLTQDKGFFKDEGRRHAADDAGIGTWKLKAAGDYEK
jgi:ABC-type nitrate/sulfonate/bicarbonate transport system substrate-binding protein